MYQLQFQSVLSHIVPQRGRFDYQHLTMVGEGEDGVGSLGNSWLIYNHKDRYSYADKIKKKVRKLSTHLVILFTTNGESEPLTARTSRSSPTHPV